ncbi:hypothetical protein [Halobellus clavatus]|uniref:Uncharacterized protein n=1 Tax=Halobellus clavatus TaxID=660517 RepID=A0A1H3GXM8_9EURY|nr:hypothetical protein [Halobellus clavatus]SDY08042.1 hypothetical protein SAMN04487946_10640 [Halobellus clavatus]
MSRWSRRAFLRASSLPILGGVAGCLEFRDSARQDVDLSSHRTEPVTDYERRTVRNEAGAALVADGASSDRIHFYDHLTDAESVPAFSDVAEARELEAFVSDTDLETDSVLLLVRPIPECYELRLTAVRKEDDGVDSEYCRSMRPADVQCEQDAEDTVGVAIRLPFAGDSFNSLGMGFSSSCRDRPSVLNFEPVTPMSNETATSTSASGGGAG